MFGIKGKLMASENNKAMALAILKEIGDQLDADIFPRIKNGGIVTPSEAAVPITTWAEENIYEGQGKRRPKTRAWTGPSRGQRQTKRGGTSSTSPPLFLSDLQVQYEEELAAVNEAYPGTKVWKQKEGLWLQTESILLHGLWQKAIFLTGIPYDRARTVRCWGFWEGIPQRYPQWIGPRHTNFPDGSICAFEPKDGTWNFGDSLIVLLDLITLWALRQLYLQVFLRWPGRQVAYHVHERLMELRPTEYCGCDSGLLYGDCCQEKDLMSNCILEAKKFYDLGAGMRRPPDVITNFIRFRKKLPEISEMLQ